MTCKDCLYHEKCYSRIAYCMDIDEGTGKEITDIEKRCESFKNKTENKASLPFLIPLHIICIATGWLLGALVFK